MNFYQQGLTAWTTRWYNGSGVFWTRAGPARQGGTECMLGKGSDNCGWWWLWWGGTRRGEAQSSRLAGVWGSDKNAVAGSTRRHTHTHTLACKTNNILLQIQLAETIHSTSKLNLNGIPLKKLSLHRCSAEHSLFSGVIKRRRIMVKEKSQSGMKGMGKGNKWGRGIQGGNILVNTYF